jgi:fluoride exporter
MPRKKGPVEMETWVAVLVGGALGSAARHGINVAATMLLGEPGPYATAAVNMIGSLAIGLLAGALAAQRLTMTTPMRTFVFVGLVGGFTTFSSFMLDTLTLAERGATEGAVLNLLGQLVLGTVLVYLGFYVGRG